MIKPRLPIYPILAISAVAGLASSGYRTFFSPASVNRVATGLHQAVDIDPDDFTTEPGYAEGFTGSDTPPGDEYLDPDQDDYVYIPVIPPTDVTALSVPAPTPAPTPSPTPTPTPTPRATPRREPLPRVTPRAESINPPVAIPTQPPATTDLTAPAPTPSPTLQPLNFGTKPTFWQSVRSYLSRLFR